MGARDMIAKAIVDRIRAFHASPHDFDKFELSKVGTGQGAQSYGHGLYFAENPKVSGVGGEYWKEFTRHFTGSGPDVDPVVSHAVQYLEHLGGDRKAALEMVKGAIEKTGNAPQRPRLEAVRDLLASDKPVGPRVYEVDIKARPEQFLDWDKPLTQQSPEVQAAATRATPRSSSFQTYPRVTGAEFYRSLGGVEPGSAAAGIGLGKVEASNALREAGIPGIRYLDQGSRQNAASWAALGDNVHPDQLRHRPPPTSNYVIFDDKLIDIMKKYAIPGAAAPVGALAAQDQYGASQ